MTSVPLSVVFGTRNETANPIIERMTIPSGARMRVASDCAEGQPEEIWPTGSEGHGYGLATPRRSNAPIPKNTPTNETPMIASLLKLVVISFQDSPGGSP